MQLILPGRKKLCIEADSSFIVDLVKSDLVQVSLRLCRDWAICLHCLSHIKFIIVSRIYREIYQVVDKLANFIVHSSQNTSWPTLWDLIIFLITSDISLRPYYRF